VMPEPIYHVLAANWRRPPPSPPPIESPND
jgi:hypothetical protein